MEFLVLFAISSATTAVLFDSDCISCATTPNAAPLEPARAASIRAFSDSSFAFSLISRISLIAMFMVSASCSTT
jgi:hypothetical protein